MAELNTMQRRLLEMFKFFHDFCEKNDITYIALDGTLLGAVRHKGFIPWDDDIDVGVPREDYNRLLGLLASSNGYYVVEGPTSEDSNFYYPYAKLYDINTTLIENTTVELKRGLFIDIFPLDGLADDINEAKKEYAIINKYLNRLAIRKVPINVHRKWYKNIILKIVQWIPFKSFNEKELCLRIDRLCQRKSIYNTKLGGNLVGAWGFKEVMGNEIIGKPQLYDFEDFKIYGPEKYDEYLTKLYGDWRKLPPLEKRTSHHDFYLDLNKSYLET